MQQIIVTCLYVLTTLVPLVFTTLNYELFEFPKFLLLITATIIIVVAWGIHMYRTHDTKLFRTPSLVHYSVISVLFTQTLAWAFSIHPSTSFWGYYSRFHQGLLTTICYSVIYFAAVKWLDKNSTQKLIKISISTAFIISLYAILQRLGIDRNLWIQDVVNRPFSTLGQPNWLAAYIAALIFIPLSYLTPGVKYWTNLGIFVLLFSTLLFTKSRSGLLAFGISSIIFWGLTPKRLVLKGVSLWVLTVVMLTAIISNPVRDLVFKPAAPEKTTGPALEVGGTESGNIRKIVWTGATRIWRSNIKNLLIGTGPETFAMAYYQYRPIEHNQTSEWELLYNKAHNEFLNYLATTGILGLGSYLILLVFMLKAFRRPQIAFLAGWLTIIVTNFWGFSVVIMQLFLFLFPAIALTIKDDQ